MPISRNIRNNRLLFFNKEGDPYNFELDTDGIYKGKLLFDENSNDTYKTLGIYVFQEVQPFEVNDYFSFNKMEIYNASGLSFIPFTNSGNTITNITRVNASDSFYSKWVFGDNLDQLYPKGTIVSFSGATFDSTNTDFTNKYYTVLDNKPDAILVNTETLNSDWDYTFNSAITATIKSHNVIGVNDYTGSAYNEINSWTLHDNKKFSIFGTELNDGVKVYADNANMKTIYQTYDTNNLTATTNDTLRFDFELKTERPKLYQGSATFVISGGTANITFNKSLNSLINLDSGEQMIFEDYDDNPILSTNPIFTIVSGTEELDLYTGQLSFVRELNRNKTYARHFDNKGLSSQNFVRNVNKSSFSRRVSFFTRYYPKRFFEYDYYIKLTGTTTLFNNNLEVGDTIYLSATTITSGSTRHKNNGRKFEVLSIEKFKETRIKHWKSTIINSKGWYDSIKKKAIDNERTVEYQLELDAIWMYNNVDNKPTHAEYIPVSQRYEKIKVKQYVIPEYSTNYYTLTKLLDAEDIRTINCTMSPPFSETIGGVISYSTTFTKNVVAYDTENILSFSQQILRMDSSDEVEFRNERIEYWENYIVNDPVLYADVVAKATANTYRYLTNPSNEIYRQLNIEAKNYYRFNDNHSGVSYIKTIDSFNEQYGTYLKDRYGILVYYNTGTSNINIHSTYTLNDFSYDKYFIPRVYLNDENISGLTTSGYSNDQINRVLLEFDDQFYNEDILPNEPEKFDINYHAEIYYDLIDNGTTDYGFILEINDTEYYTKFSGDTLTTINYFIDTYSTLFNNIGLQLSTGITILSQFGTSGYNSYSETGVSWVESGSITTISGYSLNIDGVYPNVEVRTLTTKVNIYSEYQIINEIENKSIIMSGNELEKENPRKIYSPTSIEYKGNDTTLYDYGFSTGMIINVTGSSYKENNKSYNIIGMTDTILELSYQGLFYNDALVSNVIPTQSITLPNDFASSGPLYQTTPGYTNEVAPLLSIDVERFLRKPRESANKDVYYKWRFLPNSQDKFSDDIFFYDVTGDHLKPYLGESGYTYTGPKPLWDTTDVCSERNENIILRDEPNKNEDWTSDPTKQQTVFKGKDGEYCLEFLLDEFDSVDEYDFTPEPLQVFLGFNSKNEGVSETRIVLDKVENIIFSGYTNSSDYPNGVEFDFDTSGNCTITTNQHNFNFANYGFESQQPVTIDFIDQSKTGTTIFENYGTMVIESVSSKKIKLYENIRNFQYFDDVYFNSFNTSSKTDSFYYEIKVQPNPYLYLSVYGETEIEDERFRIVLNNVGVQVHEEDEHIFKSSDIQEDGINYTLLNAKRKEMLAMYPEIYNYIGSYKAVINSINFFGWNDLQLNEYYKNLDPNSPLYQKLFKVEIPDIFDNTVPGWTPNNYIKGKYQTGKFKKTNLFNLTYKITDEEGNNVLIYSLEEIQTKLSKLKRWLKRNVLPLSTNLIDITGVAESVSQNYQNYDVSNQIQKIYCESETTVVNFVYTETLNFADNYLFEIEFYTRTGVSPSGWTCKIQTFSKASDSNRLIPQKYFKLMKNDLSNFSFNIDKNVDEYMYIETMSYNNNGVGQKYNKMINTSTSKNYLLVNNRFHIPDYQYLNVGDSYYWFDSEGHIYFQD